MKKRNVLIVTYGKGLRANKEYAGLSAGEKFHSEDSVYAKTKYFFCDNEKNDEEKTQPTPWLAEVLIKDSKPDIVIIMGTAESAWSDIYKFFSLEPYENVFRLIHDEYETNNTYNKDSKGLELEHFQYQIEHAFEESKVFGGIDKDIKVYPLLTRYGVDDSELIENYKLMTDRIDDILSADMQAFEDEVSYDFSFDITHSFRSLPIYNLIILNYFKNVTEYNVTISHVYYGNFDVHESYGKYYYEENGTEKAVSRAPIVDLSEIIGIMDLTGGVTEFRNTGNSIALQGNLEKDEKLRKRLIDFDWAMQANVYSDIVRALIELIKETGSSPCRDKNPENSEITDSKYTNLKMMIRRVIHEDIFEGKFINNDDELINYLEDKDAENGPEIQYLLCKWYRKQNRYGEAVLTAAEATLNFIIRISPEEIFFNKKGEKLTSWGLRMAIEEYFLPIGEQNNNDDNPDRELLIELSRKHNDIKIVRNVFAHNLDTFTNKEQEIDVTVESSRKMIDDYILCVGRLRDRYKENKTALAGLLEYYYKKKNNEEDAADTQENDEETLTDTQENDEENLADILEDDEENLAVMLEDDKEAPTDTDIVFYIISPIETVKEIDYSFVNASIQDEIRAEFEKTELETRVIYSKVARIIDKSDLSQEEQYETKKVLKAYAESKCLKARSDSLLKSIPAKDRKRIHVRYSGDDGLFARKNITANELSAKLDKRVKILEKKYSEVSIILDYHLNFDWKVKSWLALVNADIKNVNCFEMTLAIKKNNAVMIRKSIPKSLKSLRINKNMWKDEADES